MFFLVLIIALLVSVLLNTCIGAVAIKPMQTIGILATKLGFVNSANYTRLQEAVLLNIRLPRVAFGLLIGSCLAVTGAALQGLFRNALADPALIGISSGASMTAVAVIVLSKTWLSGICWISGVWGLPAMAFIGTLLTTLVIYRLAQVNGRIVISSLLLSGIAVNAFSGAVTGLFTYSANDAQLRSISFWMLGSLGGATWDKVIAIAPFTLLPIALLPFFGKQLNALSIGENAAIHLGVNAEVVKRIILVLTAVGVGASVSVAGIIGFIGLITPHTIRMICGPDQRLLLPLSAVAGALSLTLADLLSRQVFAPAEVPVGIITAIVGAPFFLWILVTETRKNTVYSI